MENLDTYITYTEEEIKRCKKLDDYYFEIIIENGNIPLELATISYEEYYYMLDNGSPIYNLYPKRLTDKLDYYFDKLLDEEFGEDLQEYIEQERDDIDYIFKEWANNLTQKLRFMITSDVSKIELEEEVEEEIKQEIYKTKEFAKKVKVIAKYKERVL